MSDTIELFKGAFLIVWRDGEWIHLSLPWVTLHVPAGEEFNLLMGDLRNFVDQMNVVTDSKSTAATDTLKLE